MSLPRLKGEINMETIKMAEILYAKVGKIIVGAIDEEGFPYTKAVIKHRKSINFSEIYFCTNTSSRFTKLIIGNQKASIYFCDATSYLGCYLKGKMEICQDIDIKNQYWLEEFASAYPEGNVDDPDFCLIKFTPREGRYYSMFKKHDFKFAKKE